MKKIIFYFLLLIATKVFSQPDIAIDLNYMKNTVAICEGQGLDCFKHVTFPLLNVINTQPCDIQEGCTQAGVRKLLRFGLRQMNVGDKDFDLGKVKKKPYFTFDPCHDHNHFSGFSRYELYDLNCNLVIPGGKNGGCMFNFDLDPANFIFNYPCDFPKFLNCDKRQGISAGCADIYDPTLACQYLDITNQPDGKYFLKVTINWDQSLIAAHSNLQESDYTNNNAYVLVDIQGNNVTVLYISHTIPDNDNSLVDLDLSPQIIQIFIKNQRTFLARQTITTGPNTTLNDNKQRDLIAGNKITFFPGTIFAPQPGGDLVASIDPCLSTATFKTMDGGFFATIDPSLTITAEEYVELDDEEEDSEDIPHSHIPISPNPTNGKFIISIEEEVAKHYLEIYNTLGEVVFKSLILNPNSQIDLSAHPKGIYFIKVQSRENIFSDKIIIQ